MNTVRKNLKDSESGTILLLSLLILAIIISTAGILGTVVLEHSKMSKNIENATLAFYAAESGIEKGLYTIRRAGGTFLEAKTSASLANGAAWSTDNAETANLVADINTGISQNNVIQLNLYDLDNPLHPELGLGYIIDSLNLFEAGGSGVEWVEVSWVSWTASGAMNPAKTRLYNSSLLKADGGVNITLGSGVVGHIVRIKALYGNVVDLTIKAFEAAAQKNIPGEIAIKSIGEYGTAAQSLKTVFPQRSPVFGLYDFIIFSEESLVK